MDNKKIMELIIKMNCKKCKYEWKSRKKKPKACPRCKVRLDI